MRTLSLSLVNSWPLKITRKEVVKEDQRNPEPKFPVIVELDKQFRERKKYPVRAGQTVSVNFVVGQTRY